MITGEDVVKPGAVEHDDQLFLYGQADIAVQGRELDFGDDADDAASVA